MTGADIALALVGIGLGGFLKGATGAGAPVIGVPILAIVLDVPQAVAIFAILNFLSNCWQGWSYRADLAPGPFVLRFAGAGALGAAAGTVLLASLDTRVLMGGLALVVFGYIGLRISRPGWRLARARAEGLALPVGLFGGLMQGAGGISAPVSITFLNAMGLARPEFVATISAFFVAMAAIQIPTLAAFGLLTWERAGLAALAAVPMFCAIPLGEWAARRISKETFDRLILIFLALVALRLAYAALV